MDNYVGEIRLFAGNYCPQDWHFCDGSLLPINQNEMLFAVLGITYGGDGRSTFALPKLQGMAVVGTGAISGGSNNYTLGQGGGVATVTINQAMLPQHTHTFNASTAAANTADPLNSYPAATNSPTGGYPDVKLYSPLPTGTTVPNVVMDPAMVQSAGGNQPHDNMMPYLCLNYIIALTGYYPQQQ